MIGGAERLSDGERDFGPIGLGFGPGWRGFPRGRARRIREAKLRTWQPAIGGEEYETRSNR